ncbi:unnamed protein product, partial [Rotaria sp. Silwood2]
ITGSDMPFIDQPSFDTLSNLLFIIDKHYYCHAHQAFIRTQTKYFSTLVKNHFNEMLPNTNQENNGKSTNDFKIYSKRSFV